MLKVHRPIQIACVESLMRVFGEGLYAEKLIDINLKSHKKWGARDRRSYAEIVYDIVRWWRTLACFAGVKLDFSELGYVGRHPELRDSDVEKILTTYMTWKSDPGLFSNQFANLNRAQGESLSDALDKWGEAELGGHWPQMIKSLNRLAPQYLRVNSLRGTRQELRQRLVEEGIPTVEVPGVPTALRLEERKNVFLTQTFKSGWFEMQDAGSQLIAPLLKVEPGQRVIDACAGAGGKSLHLAALMENKGRIVSMDVSSPKLNELRTRARRAGASVVEIRPIESTKTIKRLHESADRVLLDVPCTGLGVIRRHPDTKWKFSTLQAQEVMALQTDILKRYSQMTKPGGFLVYATCSVMPSENEKQVHKFLKESEGAFELEEEMKVSPIETDFDGFYGARLRRSK